MNNTKPNVVYIYADDLGRGMLSCYGQEHFKTPNMDKLAREGMRCTRAYGAAICAPARASLLCGVHDAHQGEWTFNKAGIYKKLSNNEMTLDEIYEVIHNTGIDQRCQTYLPEIFKKAGYTTGQIGKLEWGFATTGDEIKAHGWDYHYGYYDHERCHGFYPDFLFENGKKIDIEGNTDIDCGRGVSYLKKGQSQEHDMSYRQQYSQDLFDDKIKDFIKGHKDEPFFLFHPSQLPHGPVFYPEHHPSVKDLEDLTDFEKEYASMVLRLDDTVGMILGELEKYGLADNTILMLSSDNGHTIEYQQEGRASMDHDLKGNHFDDLKTKFYSETGGDVFNGNDGMAGLKRTSWEGGVTIPFIIRYPGKIEAGTVSDHFFANYDTLATFNELLEVNAKIHPDGLSYAPLLKGQPKAQKEHEYIVYASFRGPALVTRDGWKIRTYLDMSKVLGYQMFGAEIDEVEEGITYQLYHLPTDPREENDLSAKDPQKVQELKRKLLHECDGNLVNGTPQAHFAFYDVPITN